jgi:hypothetical protein
MPERLLTLLFFMAGETAEWYFSQVVADTTAVYRAQKKRADVEDWLRRHGLHQGARE